MSYFMAYALWLFKDLARVLWAAPWFVKLGFIAFEAMLVFKIGKALILGEIDWQFQMGNEYYRTQTLAEGTYYRSESPISYWMAILVQICLMVVVFFLFGILGSISGER